MIKKRIRTVDVNITIGDKKVVIPNDKEQIEIILGFRVKEAYKGSCNKEHF